MLTALVGLLCTTHVLADEARAVPEAGAARPGLAIRQQAACTAAASSVLSAIPTATGTFGKVFSSLIGTGGAISPTRVCQAIQALPSSLESEASSYENRVASWWSSDSSRIASLVSSCSSDSQIQSIQSLTSNLQAYATGCNATSSSGSVSGTSSGSQSTGASGGGASSTGSATAGSSAGAPKETGFVAGAVLAAGFLGAVIVL
ncbi:hypothetical protein SUNI508_12169 [Seiridium unicorne]|uniref:Infection structure specific protein n=1 Tax=Seiridium unicorne TaxID=138068 RepID=A0ABR2UEM0_9PEZI